MKLWQMTIALLFFSVNISNADVLKIQSVGSTSGTNLGAKTERPSRGMSKANVEKKYGQPITRKEPVGKNSKRKHHRGISRWVYNGYMVYFDDDYVIDTVSIKKKK